jgi:hypothetical protein
MENHWRLQPSQNSSFPVPSYPQLGGLSDLGQSTVNSLSKMDRQPLSFLGKDFGAKSRESWPGLGDENTNLASFSTTQLSMSIPIASSDFSAASSQSPNGGLFPSEELGHLLLSSVLGPLHLLTRNSVWSLQVTECSGECLLMSTKREVFR